MIVCPTCSREWPDEARFCMQCGASLAPQVAAAEERKVVTSLFCDLVGFTQACEAADPENIDRMMRAYNAMARRAVESYGGTVEKFIGDAVVAIFGVPSAHEDDPQRAVHAGLRIVREAEELKGLASECLRLRVGVNTGEALVRLDVTPESGEGFVTGDAVNTAARLQAAAPPMGVVIGAATCELVAGKFELEELEPVEVKGKAGRLPLWLVKSARSRIGGASERRPSTSLVGRETEKAFVNALFEKAVSVPAPQIALLVGEPGIGKSRLVAELFAYIDQRPGLTSWREGRCLPYGDGITFWALGEIVKAEAGILDTDDPETTAAKLDRTIPEGPDHEWMLNRLRVLVGLEASEASSEENFAAWLRYLESLAAERPVILVFEDLHWADEALLAFIEHLARHASDLPLFVVGTARPELFERHPAFASAAGRVNRLTLDRLSNAETGRLVAELLNAHASPALVEAISKRSEGNPFYAEESARLVVDKLAAGLDIIHGAAGPEPGTMTAEAQVPGSVQAILAARLDSLPGQLKAVLADAAVVGDVFWTGALLAVGGVGRDEVDEAVSELIDRQLVRRSRTSTMAGEQELLFWHALAREVAYQQQPRSVRARKHVAVAAWLEERAGGRSEDFAEVLAHHYATALDLARSLDEETLAADLAGPAARHLTAAGERAGRLDLPTALRYFARALDILPQGGSERGLTLRLQARALCLCGRPREGIEAYLEAIECLRSAGDGNAAACCTVDMALWMATAADDRWKGNIDHIHELLDDSTPSPDLVHAYQELSGVQSVRLWEYEAAMRSADEALKVADRLGLPAPPGVYEWRSEAKACLGDPSYLDDYRRALELAEEQDVGSNALARLRHNHAHIQASSEGPAKAREALAANIEFAERRGMEFWVSTGRCSEAALLLAQGLWHEARQAVEELCCSLIEAGWGEGEELTIVKAVSASLLARTGRANGEAVDEAARLIAWLPGRAVQGVNDALLATTCLLAAAELRMCREDAEGCRALLEQCLACPGFGPWGPCCEGCAEGLLPSAVRLSLNCGDPELGARLLVSGEALTKVDECGITSARGLLEEAAGMYDAAAGTFAAAAAGWGGLGVPWEQGHALLGRGRCLLALGRPEEAREYLDRAAEIFERLGAAPALAEIESLHSSRHRSREGTA